MVAAASQNTSAEAGALIRAGVEQRAINELAWFVRLLWPIVEPGRPLIWNWHLDVVCYELERVVFGEVVGFDEATGEALREYTADLVICIPPGLMKSLLVSVFLPAFQWLHRPERRSLYVANSDSLVKRDSRRTRDIVRSAVYDRLVRRHMRAVWHRLHAPPAVAVVPPIGSTAPPARGCPSRAYRALLRNLDDPDDLRPWGFRVDQGEIVNFGNDCSGYRQCKAIGAKITGERADGLCIDDPYDVKAVIMGSAARQSERMGEVVSIYDTVLSSRLNDKAKRKPDGSGGYYRIVIMQRIHEDDLAGVLIKRGYRAVVLPMEFDPNPDEFEVHPRDPRTEADALLFPARFDREVIDTIRTYELGDRHYLAQHGQNPAPATGGTFKREWFAHRYDTHPQSMPFDEWAMSIDADFGSDAEGSSYVVVQVWGRRGGASFYLLDQVRKRMNFPDTIEAIRKLRKKWTRIGPTLIEKKANGAALIDTLRGEIPFMIAFTPRASKEARANVAAMAYAAGNVQLPANRFARFMAGREGFVTEHLKFPGGRYDDQVDAESQMLIHWTVGFSDDAFERTKRQFGAWTG